MNELHEVRRGDVISIPGYKKSFPPKEVARVWYDENHCYLSYLRISFVGGLVYTLNRFTRVDTLIHEEQDEARLV